MTQKSREKFEIVYEACKQATKERMKVLHGHFDLETMLKYPKDYCCFRVVDVNQDAIKNLTSYIRKNARTMGLMPVHSHGGYAKYMFKVPPFRDKLLSEALGEINE